MGKTLKQMRRETGMVPVARIRDRLDMLTARKDYESAARLLEYWLAEARSLMDREGEFTVLNEMMGIYRRLEDKARALECANAAVALIPVMGSEDTVGAGTAYVNAGTVYDFCGDPAGALEHFARARALYEKHLDPDDARLGGLYNNMGLALADTGRFEEAFRCYSLALEVMQRQTYGKADQAITWLNMADAAKAARGMEEAEEEIREYLQTAETLLLDQDLPRNGYYAFVCEKCAPVFSYYGWFQTASELRQLAEQIRGGEKR